jgi:hypothetical protein
MQPTSPQRLARRGAPRLIEHFEALDRVTANDGPNARTRLERELGPELAHRLVGALARARSCRPAPPA